MRALALLLLLAAAASAAPPAFTLLPLGARGGTFEGDLSCFALKAAEEERYRLVLDAGSVAEGAARHLGTRDPARVQEFVLGIEHYLLTHSHMDHLAGMVLVSPAFFARPDPVQVTASGATLAVLREHVFNGEVWGDFFELGRLVARPLEPGETATRGGFRVTAVPLEHPVPSQGYLLERPDGAAFLHTGDTGPTGGDVPLARRLLAAGRLRALSLECSFPDAQVGLALSTGHLTPDLLAKHLVRIATGEVLAPEAPLPERALRRAAAAFRGVPVLVHHVKPEGETTIRAELSALRRRGLPLVGLHPGKKITF